MVKKRPISHRLKASFGKTKKGVYMKRMHRVLSLFSRGSKDARLNQLMFRNIKTVKTNANGTSGYMVKPGKNSGKILGHIRKASKNI